ncbi:MAG TPA: peptide deformylase [bacterium]|nr:peptide deformylase [bacterium]
MVSRPVRLLGDPVLRQKCDPVTHVDGATDQLVADLIATVDTASGLGLAAPQIGVCKRAIVVVSVDGEGCRHHHALLNPEIISACGEETCEEGCLSIPGIYANVKRPQSVIVSGLDRAGKKVNMEASGMMARAFAHEIDHLDGVLFIDRIGMVKRNLLRNKLNSIKNKAKEMAKSPR